MLQTKKIKTRHGSKRYGGLLSELAISDHQPTVKSFSIHT